MTYRAAALFLMLTATSASPPASPEWVPLEQIGLLQRLHRGDVQVRATGADTSSTNDTLNQTRQNTSIEVVLASSSQRSASASNKACPVCLSPDTNPAYCCQPWPLQSKSMCVGRIKACLIGKVLKSCNAMKRNMLKCATDFCCHATCVTQLQALLPEAEAKCFDALPLSRSHNGGPPLISYNPFEYSTHYDPFHEPVEYVCGAMRGKTGTWPRRRRPYFRRHRRRRSGLTQVAAETRDEHESRKLKLILIERAGTQATSAKQDLEQEKLDESMCDKCV